MPHRHSHVLATLHEADGADDDEGHRERALREGGVEPHALPRSAPPSSCAPRSCSPPATGPSSTRPPCWGRARRPTRRRSTRPASPSTSCASTSHFAEQLLTQQPEAAPENWNMTDYRPLDGFVFAVAPFNFTSIALQPAHRAGASWATWCCSSPRAPRPTAPGTSWSCCARRACPTASSTWCPVTAPPSATWRSTHPQLGGIHFTGSTPTFQSMWRTVGENIARYKQYPRLVGETGGKDFIFVHASAADDLDAVAMAIVRGGYEYQGQKCSAASRIYVPQSMWPKLQARGCRSSSRELQHGRRPRTSGTSWARSSTRALQADLALPRARQEQRQRRHRRRRRRRGPQRGLVRAAHAGAAGEPAPPLMEEEIFAPRRAASTSTPTRSSRRRCARWTRPPPTRSPAPSSRATARPSSTAMDRCATPPATSTSTTSPPAPWWASSPSAAAAPRAPTTRPARCSNLVRWTSPRTIKETFVPPTRVRYPYLDK